jgi:hypothetical protein
LPPIFTLCLHLGKSGFTHKGYSGSCDSDIPDTTDADNDLTELDHLMDQIDQDLNP